MRWAVTLIALVVAAHLAWAVPPAVTIPVTMEQVQSAIAQAVPQPCPTVPASDTLNGSVGGGCYAPGASTRATSVQAGNTTTDGSGNWSVIFARPFTSAVPFIRAEPMAVSSGSPMQCNWSTRSATGAAGFCDRLQSTTLGGTLTSVLSAVITPFTPAVANTPITWTAREPTQ